MFLLLLKVTLLLAVTLLTASSLRRSSAALRHLICVCGLAGTLLVAITLLAPSETAVFHISVLSAPGTARLTTTANSIALPASWIWLLGSVLLLCRIALGYLRLGLLLHNAEPTPVPGTLFADVSVPVVTGLFRPVILLPRDAMGWPGERWDAVLRHERAHLSRHDLWTLLLSHAACAVWWFHPLAWMVAAQLRREQEQAADDAVLLSGISAASYAEALLAAAQNLTTTNLIGCHMLTKNTFRSRIARLLTNGMPRVSSSFTLHLAGFAFAGAVLMLGLMSGSAQGQDSNGVYSVSADKSITPPRTISRIEPAYTETARKAKYSGVVVLSVVVGTDGRAHDINVVKALGMGLDESAVNAVQTWSFEPARKDGKPVKVRSQIEIKFKLL